MTGDKRIVTIRPGKRNQELVRDVAKLAKRENESFSAAMWRAVRAGLRALGIIK